MILKIAIEKNKNILLKISCCGSSPNSISYKKCKTYLLPLIIWFVEQEINESNKGKQYSIREIFTER